MSALKKDSNAVHLRRNLSPMHNPVFNMIKNLERSYQRLRSGNDFRVGVSWLNEMTNGRKPHGFILVAGDPLLMRTIVFKSSMEDIRIPVALFSQMERENVLLEMMSLETGIHVMDLKEGRLRPDDWPSLAYVAGRLTNLPVFIEKPRNIAEACSRARSLAEDFAIRALFIDDLRPFYACRDLVDNPEVTDCLGQLSRELGISVFGGLSA